MHVLIDECLPRQLRLWLSTAQPDWTSLTVQEAGWAAMKNGHSAARRKWDIRCAGDGGQKHASPAELRRPEHLSACIPCGACAQHDDCEHAFHVVGRARGTVILNNRIRDFNAPLKINGERGAWPDDGLLQFTTLANTAPRRTELPVSFVDSVSASGWQFVDNHIENTAKDGGNRISYGFCVKGAGQQMRIERNLVVCSPQQVSQAGLRVGISLGCGATGKEFCRDGRCDVELSDSVVANNVVAHCNDFGIDLHRVQNAVVAHNTLINTAGIDARQATIRGMAVGNLLEGRVRARDGARPDELDNAMARSLDALLAAPNALDLRWHEPSDQARATPETERDFCGHKRPAISPPGATLQPKCQ